MVSRHIAYYCHSLFYQFLENLYSISLVGNCKKDDNIQSSLWTKHLQVVLWIIIILNPEETSMRKIFFHNLYIALMVALLGISPVVLSGQTDAGNLDVVAPEIKRVIVPSDVYSGSSLTFKVKATDNVVIKSVALYYRFSGLAEQYKKLIMKHKPTIDEYQITIDVISGGKIEYYVEVMDTSGNVSFHGSSFSPIDINVQLNLEPGAILGKKDGVLTEKEIISLFSNRTVDGHHEKRNFEFVRFFSADGKLYGNNPVKGRRVGRWDVNSEGLCFHWTGGRKQCRKITIEKGVVKQYKVKGSGEEVLATIYTRFRNGNPEQF